MDLHDRENNEESQKHLQENSKKFKRQCLKVYELLLQGKKLTTMNAPSYGILSLPRRIKDLRDLNGIHIDDHWLKGADGKPSVKEWFILKKVERPTKKKVIEKFNELQQLNLL